MTPEQKARQEIDNLLTKAGWVIQNMDEINLGAGLGVALSEFQSTVEELESPSGHK